MGVSRPYADGSVAWRFLRWGSPQPAGSTAHENPYLCRKKSTRASFQEHGCIQRSTAWMPACLPGDTTRRACVQCIGLCRAFHLAVTSHSTAPEPSSSPVQTDVSAMPSRAHGHHLRPSTHCYEIERPAFLTGLAHLFNLVPYQRRAEHAGQCGVEVEGGRVPTAAWIRNLQIRISG